MEREQQRQEDRILALEKGQISLQNGQKDMLELLRPISETYTTVSFLGKWVMASAVFVSIIIGIILGFKSIK